MNKFLLLLGTAGLLLTAGCRKEDQVVCAPSNTIITLADFSRRNTPAEQVFNLPDVSQNQTVRTYGGAVLTIWGNTLLSSRGPATGAAQLRLREIYEVPDMVLANLPTQTHAGLVGPNRTSTPLESGGAFQVEIWQGTERLYLEEQPLPSFAGLISNRPIRASRLRSSPSWYVQREMPPTASDNVGWHPMNYLSTVAIDTSSVAPGVPALYDSYLVLNTASWYNIGWLWGTSPALPSAAVEIFVPNDAEQTTSTMNTRVYLVPARSNVALRPSFSPAINGWRFGNLPATLAYTAVVIQSGDAGGLRFATQQFTLDATAGSSLIIAPVPMSEAAIVRLIRQLQGNRRQTPLSPTAPPHSSPHPAPGFRPASRVFHSYFPR